VSRLLLCALLLQTTFAEPRRIVSTAPSITEILFALGLGDRVVGVTTYCHYPPETARIAKIGTYLQPNIEVIASLRPDLIITPKTAVQSRAQFAGVSASVLEVRHDRISDVYEAIEKIGEATAVGSRASALNASMRDQLDKIHKVVSRKPATSVMFIVGRTPGTLDGLIVAGKRSYLGDIMEFAGGRNVFSETSVPYLKISHEEVLARDPEVIIDMGDVPDATKVTAEHDRAVVALWKRFPRLRAVREKHVYALASEIFMQPGPRVTQAALEFAKLLHPDLFQ
jgi:iron complex transport system substrate-binding protein